MFSVFEANAATLLVKLRSSSLAWHTCLIHDPLICIAGEHIENTLEALTALIQKDNATPGGLETLAYVEFDVHVSTTPCNLTRARRS